MNNISKWLIGGVATLAVTGIVKKGISASKAVPKFLTPRNFKRNKFTLNFDLPFSLLNITANSYTIDGLGGTIFYPVNGENLEFASFYLNESIKVNSNSNDVFVVKCTTYLPDIIGTVKAFIKFVVRPLDFKVIGAVRIFGVSLNYNEPIKITFISEIISLFKTALAVRK